MRALTLTLRNPLRQRLDVSLLTPGYLQTLTVPDIGALPLWLGRQQTTVGELFDIHGDVAPTVVLRNTGDRLDGIGSGMDAGTLIVEGAAGLYAGRGMRGGTLHIHGSCGAYAGAVMQGGVLRIDGDAGDHLGGVPAGERVGMRGGVITVRGRAGARAGDRMRRGLLLIEGDVGAYCGSRLIAGTVIALGQVGAGAGFAMQRGTLLCRHMPAALPASFCLNGERDLHFLPLLIGSLAELDRRYAELPQQARVTRYVGDRACGGLGELLILSGE